MERMRGFWRALPIGLAMLIAAVTLSLAEEPVHSLLIDTTDFQLETGIPFSFTNGADEPVGVIFSCFTWLQGLRDGEWTDLFTPDCTNVRVFPEVVPPGETFEDVFPLTGIDPEILNGREAFRLRSSLHRQGQPEEELLSDPFVLPLD